MNLANLYSKSIIDKSKYTGKGEANFSDSFINLRLSTVKYLILFILSEYLIEYKI